MPVTAGVVEIPLTQGKVALVDEADMALIAGHKWFAYHHKGLWYAHSNVWAANGQQRGISMHRTIMCARNGQRVDHRDGDGLNNQRSNLRFCTQQENCRNRHRTSGASGFKGVYPSTGAATWRAAISDAGGIVQLGSFRTREDAARAYDAAALRLFGEFAALNFPDGGRMACL